MAAENEMTTDQDVENSRRKDAVWFLAQWGIAMLFLRFFCGRMNVMIEAYEELPVTLSLFSIGSIRLATYFGQEYAGMVALAVVGALLVLVLWKLPLSRRQRLALGLLPTLLFLVAGVICLGAYAPMFTL